MQAVVQDMAKYPRGGLISGVCNKGFHCTSVCFMNSNYKSVSHICMMFSYVKGHRAHLDASSPSLIIVSYTQTENYLKLECKIICT